jgi:MFS family permease
MTQLNLRIGNKQLGKKLITGLVPLFGRNSEARKSLRGAISPQSRQGLDWMNFFLADVQTAFGGFIAFYLADLGWSKGQVGLALTVGTLAGVISQIPGGALVDALRWKRGVTAIGIGMLCVSALIFALMPSFVLVFFAEILHGLTAGIVTPAIAAISLGLVGRQAMSLRTGRNYQFNAAGNALTAGLMGLAGQYFAKSAIFFGAAALCIPALIALSRIRADEIDYARARRGKARRPRVTIASSIWAKTAISTSLLPAFSYSNSPTLRCCRLLARTWRKARPNTHHYSWLP